MNPSYKNHIVSTPTVLFGKPRVKGTRIPVQQVLGCLAEGWDPKKIMDQFPVLRQEDIQACVSYASDFLGNIRVIRYSPKAKVHA